MTNIWNKDSDILWCLVACQTVPFYSGQRISKKVLRFLILNMKEVRFFEASVFIYHSARGNIAEDTHVQLCSENLRLCKISDFQIPRPHKSITAGY